MFGESQLECFQTPDVHETLPAESSVRKINSFLIMGQFCNSSCISICTIPYSQAGFKQSFEISQKRKEIMWILQLVWSK